MKFNGVKLEVATRIIAFVAVFISLISFIYSSSYLKALGVPFESKDVSVVIYKNDAIELMRKLELQVKDIDAKLKGISELPKELPVASKIIELETKIENIQKSLNDLNKIIVESPEKALELPLVRRDISAMEQKIDSSVKNVETQLARAYDMFKWVLGTLVISVLSLAIGMFFKDKREKNT